MTTAGTYDLAMGAVEDLLDQAFDAVSGEVFDLDGLKALAQQVQTITQEQGQAFSDIVKEVIAQRVIRLDNQGVAAQLTKAFE